MGFQILFNNEPISLNDLDKESAEFWNVPIKQKEYAMPIDINTLPIEEALGSGWQSWFDLVGWNIHISHADNWDKVKDSIAKIAEKPLEDLYHNEFILPYLKLIDHWSDKGYIPKFVED